MKKSVRIGGAGGFWGDSASALEQLVQLGEVDYIIQDYLAELTMAIMAKQKARNPQAGFATDFVDMSMKPVIVDIAKRGIKVVTNAGGLNPKACAAALRKLATSHGVQLRVAVVEGDDLKPREDALRAANTQEMFTGEPLPANVATMNAYTGAFPIAAALAAGADVVITGRAADSALALGPLIHEFGWGPDDFDQLAAGSMAGHLIECGTQTTGGLFTDWRMVHGRENLGYPIAECFPDGKFNLTKPMGTGGLVKPLVAVEQMLYEVGDPRNYLLPDVTCDLSDTKVVEIGDNIVQFSGIKGRTPTSTYKVSAVHLDGYRGSSTLTIIGRDAREKAAEVGRAIIERANELLRRSNLGPFTETNVELLGAEVTSFGESANHMNPREIVLRVSVRHAEKAGVDLLGREMAPFGTAGTPGTTGFSGRLKPQEVYRLFSFLVPKDKLDISVSLDDGEVAYEAPKVGGSFTEAKAPARKGNVPAGQRKLVPLRSIAVARSGDKADISHLALIAREPRYYDVMLEQLNIESVSKYFSHLVRGEVVRYEVPGTNALIFMLHQGLGGGGTASLRSDALGKAFGEIALDMDVMVPSAWDVTAPYAKAAE